MIPICSMLSCSSRVNGLVQRPVESRLRVMSLKLFLSSDGGKPTPSGRASILDLLSSLLLASCASSDNRPVVRLPYSAYSAFTLKSFKSIAEAMIRDHVLENVCIVRRLGHLPAK